MATYYIDYENVHNAGLHGVDALSVNDTVRIFYKDNDTMQLPQVKALLESAATIRFDRVRRSTPNALDFQLLAELFCIADVTQQYYIISRDKGYDSAIDVARSHSISLQRKEAIDARDFFRNSTKPTEPSAEVQLLAADEEQEPQEEIAGEVTSKEEPSVEQSVETELPEAEVEAAAEEDRKVQTIEEYSQETAPETEAESLQPAEEAETPAAQEELPVVEGLEAHLGPVEEPNSVEPITAPSFSEENAATEEAEKPVKRGVEVQPAQEQKASRNRRGRKTNAQKKAEQAAAVEAEAQKSEAAEEYSIAEEDEEQKELAAQPKKQKAQKSNSRQEKQQKQNRQQEKEPAPAREEARNAFAAVDPADGKKVEAVVLHNGIQNVSSRQYDLIAEAVRNSDNKNRFYQYFVKKLGAEKGLELYNHVKSHYQKFVDALK